MTSALSLHCSSGSTCSGKPSLLSSATEFLTAAATNRIFFHSTYLHYDDNFFLDFGLSLLGMFLIFGVMENPIFGLPDAGTNTTYPEAICWPETN